MLLKRLRIRSGGSGRRSRRSLVGCESGQGTLEYILVLVIIVILALGLLYKFNTAFRAYAQALIGGYIACLLETGELPGNSPECSGEFANFDMNSGRQLVNGQFGSGGGGKSGSNAASANKNERRDGRGGGGGDGASSSSGRTTVARLGEGGRPASVNLGQVKDEKDSAGAKRQTYSGNVYVGRVRANSGRREVLPMDSRMESEGASQKEARPQVAKAGKVSGDADGLRPTKTAHKLAERKVAGAPEDGKSFTIGALVRLLMIVLIIIAIVLLFGGQLLQISKSREKGGD